MTREELQSALGHLERELDRQACVARIYLVANRVVHVTYRRPSGKSRWDIMDLLLPDDKVLHDATRSVAETLGLPHDWLDETARHAALDPQPSGIAPALHNKPALVVAGAPESYVLMAKVHASRPCDRDDILWLMKRLDLANADAAHAFHDLIFPTEMLDDDVKQAMGARLRNLCQ